MTYQIQFGSKLPDYPEANGFDVEHAQTLVGEWQRSRTVRPRVAVILYDVGEVKSKADGTDTAVARLRWVQRVEDRENLRAVRQMLEAEYLTQRDAMILPAELDALRREAFWGVDLATDEIDEEQARRAETMTKTDDLREHLKTVHRIAADGMTEAEMRREHDADHAYSGMAMAEGHRHGEAWLGWMRVDLEAAEIEADDHRDDVLSDEHEAAADRLIFSSLDDEEETV